MNKTRRRFAILLLLSSLILHPSSFPLLAQAPQIINYQGRLLNGTNLVNGNVGLSLRLFNVPSGGASLFEDSNTVAVADGLYSTLLGDNPVSGSLETALANSEVWIEVAVNGTTLTPREQLVSAAYAIHAWGLSGNKGTTVGTHFIGTIDDQPIEVRVDGARAARFAPSNGAPNIVLGPAQNVVSNGARGVSILGGSNNAVSARSDYVVLAGGQGNRIGADSLYASVAGGQDNAVSNAAFHAVIGGGFDNRIGENAGQATIGGGSAHRIGANSSAVTIAGGAGNTVDTDASNASIGGGGQNVIGRESATATIGGGNQNAIHFAAQNSTIGGGLNNAVHTGATYSAIGGGANNAIQRLSSYGTIGGGYENSIGLVASYTTIAGGGLNAIGNQALNATIGGGWSGEVMADDTTIAGGNNNSIGSNAVAATIGGGMENSISNSARYATIPGGWQNKIGSNATNAFAAGRRAVANHRGAFVWGDDTNADVASTANNQATFRASGGFRIFTSSGINTGVQVAANSGAWTSISDVNAKESFAPVDTRDVLAKVAAMPITTWRYKGQDQEIRHMGPTAQDFYAAFGLGDLPGTGITTIDADGVALAAIQALARENGELKKENEALRTEIEAIKARLGM